jgi:YegS/Rv2252/BmrU family lipid kinase
VKQGCRDWEPAATVISCESKDDLDDIIDRAEQDGVDVVCAVGGDGTVHEIAKRLIGRNAALAILPTGSGNGFARHLGVPLDALKAIDSICTGRIETIDAAEVNGLRFLGTFGIGFDALVAHRFAQQHARGLRTYVTEGALAYLSYKPETYRLTTGGTVSEVKAFALAVANSNQYGNEAKIAPRASLQDGLLDVVAISAPSMFTAPSLLARLFGGSFDKAMGVTSLQVDDILIEREAEGAAHLDGEPLMLPQSMHVKVLRGALKVVVPVGRQKI